MKMLSSVARSHLPGKVLFAARCFLETELNPLHQWGSDMGPVRQAEGKIDSFKPLGILVDGNFFC